LAALRRVLWKLEIAWTCLNASIVAQSYLFGGKLQCYSGEELRIISTAESATEWPEAEGNARQIYNQETVSRFGEFRSCVMIFIRQNFGNLCNIRDTIVIEGQVSTRVRVNPVKHKLSDLNRKSV
jgi:hypothetical protein